VDKNKLIDKYKKFVPASVRKILRGSVSFVDYNIHQRQLRNPFHNEPDSMIFPGSRVTLGIFKENYQYHKSYIAACRSLKVSYKLLDLYSPDWQQRVNDSGCDAFLVWPSVGLSVWKEMVDDKIRILTEDMGKVVFPSIKEVWLYENKNRTQDWLRAQNIPHPKTWLFFDEKEALKFAESCTLPMVYKTNLGSTASGVKILREREALKAYIKKAFRIGIVPGGHHPLDRNWGRVFLQQHMGDVEEWRMIRIGDSFFGYRKERVGDFHSGSHHWSWLDPGKELLDFTKMVTDKGNFRSMDVDVFRTKQGELFVNELQTVFGATTPKEMLMIDGVEGRYRFYNGVWNFEIGNYSDNQCSNLRVLYLLEEILQKTVS
jgi:hypothetical protein